MDKLGTVNWQAALVEHVKSAVYQGAHIWGKTLLPDPLLPSLTDWWWVKTEGMHEPYWMMLPQASQSCNGQPKDALRNSEDGLDCN